MNFLIDLSKYTLASTIKGDGYTIRKYTLDEVGNHWTVTKDAFDESKHYACPWNCESDQNYSHPIDVEKLTSDHSILLPRIAVEGFDCDIETINDDFLQGFTEQDYERLLVSKLFTPIRIPKIHQPGGFLDRKEIQQRASIQSHQWDYQPASTTERKLEPFLLDPCCSWWDWDDLRVISETKPVFIDYPYGDID